MRVLLTHVMVTIITFAPRVSWAADTVGELGYGPLLLRMTLGLGAVCVLAVLVLKKGVGLFSTPRGSAHLVRVLDRVLIEPRRSVVVLKVSNRVFIVGISDAGMQPLGELEAAEVEIPTHEAAPPSRFAEMFHVKQSEEVR